MTLTTRIMMQFMRKTTDRQQSVTAKVSQLTSLQSKLNRRLSTIAKKDGFGSVYPKSRNIYMKKKQPDKIILGAFNYGNSIYYLQPARSLQDKHQQEVVLVL